MCVSGYPNMRLSCRNALPNVRLSVPDTAASIAGEHRALGRREKRFSDGDSGLAMARPEALVSIGGGSRVSQTYSGDRGLRPRGVLLVGLSVAVGVLVSKFLVRLIGRPVARRVSRQSVAQTIVRGPRRDDHALAARRSLGDRVPLYRPPRGDRRLLRRDRDHPRAARRELHQRRVHPRGPAVRNRRHDRVRERDNRVRRGHHDPVHEDIHARQYLPRRAERDDARARRDQLLRRGRADPADDRGARHLRERRLRGPTAHRGGRPATATR